MKTTLGEVRKLVKEALATGWEQFTPNTSWSFIPKKDICYPLFASPDGEIIGNLENSMNMTVIDEPRTIGDDVWLPVELNGMPGWLNAQALRRANWKSIAPGEWPRDLWPCLAIQIGQWGHKRRAMPKMFFERVLAAIRESVPGDWHLAAQLRHGSGTEWRASFHLVKSAWAPFKEFEAAQRQVEKALKTMFGSTFNVWIAAKEAPFRS